MDICKRGLQAARLIEKLGLILVKAKEFSNKHAEAKNHWATNQCAQKWYLRYQEVEQYANQQANYPKHVFSPS